MTVFKVPDDGSHPGVSGSDTANGQPWFSPLYTWHTEELYRDELQVRHPWLMLVKLEHLLAYFALLGLAGF